MTVVLSKLAQKQIKKLDNSTRKIIIDFLSVIEKLENPRSRGKALIGNFRGFWRYRVGDYRILCKINDGELVINIIKVAHRREIYD